MKILALITDAYGGHGGIAKFNRDLLNATITLPEVESVTAIPYFKPFALEQTPPKIKYVLTGLNSRIKYLFAVWRAVRHEKFDLLICGHINLLPLALFFWKKFKQRALIMHGLEAWQDVHDVLKAGALRHFQNLIAVSELTKQRFNAWAHMESKRWFILPNCVSLEEYQVAPRNADLMRKHQTEGKKVLMTVARLVPGRNKGVDPILEVLPELSRKIPALRYLVVGTGPDQLRLKQRCQQLGIRHIVEFAGFVREKSKPDLYRLADVFIMAGDQEGFGIVYLEAMACGVPVIASTLDGSREAVMEGKLGQMVNPQNSEEIKTAILNAFQTPAGTRPQGLDYFSYENFVTRTQAIIRQIQQ